MQPRRMNSLLRAVAAGVLAAVAAAACDDSFTPLSPTRLQYSVFGYLDASADTQWIRVMPIRELVPTQPDSFGATVTLEELGGGGRIVLRDSVFRFVIAANPDVGSEGVYLHNFWTAERITPGVSYRITVARPGEPVAEAEVAVPQDYQVELWLRQQGAAARDSDQLRLTGVKHVPFASATGWYYDDCGTRSAAISLRVPAPAGDSYALNIRRPGIVVRGCGPVFAEKVTLWAAGSEAEWPAGEAYGTSNVGVPEGVSNITHSVGFVAGVMTKSVPYDSCAIVGPAPLPTYCKLRYDASSASIYGTVRDARCGLGKFDTMLVQLSEIDANTTGHRKVRPVRANRSGQFEITGLDPGVRYFFQPRPPTRLSPPPFPTVMQLYAPFADTVVFQPGERRRYDVGLYRLDDCSVQ